MSFLRETKKLINHLKNRKPSPTYHSFFQDPAQGSTISCGKSSRKNPQESLAERISLFTFLKNGTEAGMTVEAAVVLPIFLYALLNLGCAIELIRLHGNIQLALWETCSKVSIYGYALDDAEIAPFFTWGYVRNQLTDSAGREYLDNAPLKNGSGGLQLWESDFFSDGDELDVIVTYEAAPWSPFAAFRPFRMANRFCAHLWNGYGIPEDPESAKQLVDVVYMTENGEVYHKDRNCTHIKLSVREVSRLEAQSAVNRQGSRYTPCEKCGQNSTSGKLYLTDEGDRYHTSADCPGLKRTVFSVPAGQAENYPLCTRCR